MRNCDTREALMKQIQMYTFAVVEANLYLDVYPDNCIAREYLYKYQKLLDEATALYSEKYSPITVTQSAHGSFNWLDEPWPWHLQQ